MADLIMTPSMEANPASPPTVEASLDMVVLYDWMNFGETDRHKQHQHGGWRKHQIPDKLLPPLIRIPADTRHEFHANPIGEKR